MSGHHNAAPSPPDQRLVIVPEGARAHTVTQPFKGFKFREHEATPKSFIPRRAFEHNTPGMEAENYQPAYHEFGDIPTGQPDHVATFRSDNQTVYALLEVSKNSDEPDTTLKASTEALSEYWQGVEQSGAVINADNVGGYMRQALNHVKNELIAAGNDATELSTGMTMVKLFRHADGWGAAIAHAGNTTHGFISNHDKTTLQGHGHIPNTRTGRIMDLTQAEFDPHERPGRFQLKAAIKQSSLNSDPNQGAESERVYVIPRILRSSEIVLCNDQVVGSLADPLKHTPQTIADRESALLDNENPDQAAQKLFSSRHDPASAAMFIRLEEIASSDPTKLPDDTGNRSRKKVSLAKHGAKLIREFVTSDSVEMKHRRRTAAKIAGVTILATAAAIIYRKLPDAKKEAFDAHLSTQRDIAAKKAGELLLSIKDLAKQKTETVRDKLEVPTKKSRKVDVLQDAVETAIKHPVETVGSDRRVKYVTSAFKKRTETIPKKAKEIRGQAQRTVSKLRQSVLGNR